LRQLAVSGGYDVTNGVRPSSIISLPLLEILKINQMISCGFEVDILSSVQMPRLNTLILLLTSNDSIEMSNLAECVSHTISRLVLRGTHLTIGNFIERITSFSFPNLSEIDIAYDCLGQWSVNINDESSTNELEERVRDLIMACSPSGSHSGFNNSRSGVRKVTLMPCSEKMRKWLEMHVEEIGSTPYIVQDGW